MHAESGLVAVLQVLGALLNKSLNFFILAMEGGLKVSFPRGDVLLLGIQKCFALLQVDLPGSNILLGHGYHLMFPQKGLKLLAMPLTQLVAFVP